MRHEQFERMIDESLVSGVPAEASLRVHLEGCAQCRKYLAASNRAIAAMSGFSFEVDPGLEAKVMAAVRGRAATAHPKRQRWGLVWVGALGLTAVGSLLEMEFGGLAASVLHMGQTQVRGGLLEFWVLPSLCFLVLFPLLPLLAESGKNRKGWTV